MASEAAAALPSFPFSLITGLITQLVRGDAFSHIEDELDH